MQNEKNYEKKTAVIVFFILLSLWFSIFLMKKIDLTTADLGRHIKNGEIILSLGLQNFSRPDVFEKNFYSYTNQDFPFINHHWGSGVIFYLINKISGFLGLSFFYILLSSLTFGIFFYIAKKEAGWLIASSLSLILIPLMASRAEIRPEIFTYFFSGVFFLICFLQKTEKISAKWLYLIVLFSFLWINLHIGFFFGFVIMACFLAEETITWIFFLIKKNKKPFSLFSKNLFFVFFLSLFSIILNPNGLKGVLEPLNIFKEYGYLVVENQSIWFLEKLGHTAGLNFFLIKLSFALLFLSFVFVLIKKRKYFSLSNLFLATATSVMAFMGLRNFPFFGFFALPIMAKNIAILLKIFKEEITKKIVLTTSIIIIIIFFIHGLVHFYNQKTIMGLGLMEKANNSAIFFKENNIKGPIFNNYDIGGYLIYHLYPEYKVFVDNRPEAYPVLFFKETYIPSQEDNKKWEELQTKYNFNVIFFSWRDYTPWGQNFLVQKIEDKDWAPVFADNYNIIFVKRNDLNKNIIEKYELPKEMFRVIKKARKLI